MWNKIKNWLGVIAGAVIGFLMFLLRIKSKKISDLKEENKVKDVEINVTNIAKEEENEQAKKIVEIKKETDEKIDDVKAKKTSYNDLIEEWNEK